MAEDGLKRRTAQGVLWSFMERVLAQGVSFAVSIVLARMLLPSEYGVIAIVLVVINICNVFFSAGFCTSLIQVKEADETDFSTAFWGSVFLSFFLYIIVFFGARPLANLYGKPILCPVIRVMGLTLAISALKSIQKAYISRKMQFKKFFWATLGGTIAAAVVGILMARNGYGVWALVAQYMTNAIIDTIVLQFMIEWRPKWLFSWNRMKVLFSFGGKVLGASLIYTFYEELRTLIIGKVYSDTDLAFYNKGKQLPGFIVNNINSAIASTLLPAISKLQDDSQRVKAVIRRFNRIGALIMLPMMVGMMVVAEPVVKILLTEKWLPCVPFLRIMCVYYALMPLQEANTQAVLAVGRSDLSLKAEIVKRGVNVLIIILTYKISIDALAWGEIAAMGFSFLINAALSKKMFSYGAIEQFKDIFPYIVMSLGMASGVKLVSLFLESNLIVMLVVQVAVGIGIYAVLLRFFRDESVEFVKGLLETSLKRNK